MTNNATIIRARRKSLKLTVTNKGELVITAPLRMQLTDIEKYVEEKGSWIKNKIEYAKRNISKNRFIINHQDILLGGEPLHILVDKSYKKLSIDNTNIYVPSKGEDKTIPQIITWYKKLAKEMLDQRIQTLSQKTGISYKSVKISNAKTRWGSCDSAGNIKLNYRLIMLHSYVIDYVIIHELVHRVEFNHSKKFYDIISKLVPQWKVIRKELKSYGFLLSMYRG